MTSNQDQARHGSGRWAEQPHDEGAVQLYPNGQCPGCGHGVDEHGVCRNEECGHFERTVVEVDETPDGYTLNAMLAGAHETAGQCVELLTDNGDIDALRDSDPRFPNAEYEAASMAMRRLRDRLDIVSSDEPATAETLDQEVSDAVRAAEASDRALTAAYTRRISATVTEAYPTAVKMTFHGDVDGEPYLWGSSVTLDDGTEVEADSGPEVFQELNDSNSHDIAEVATRGQYAIEPGVELFLDIASGTWSA